MKVSVGRVQMRILEVLWEEGEATAKHLTERLSKVEPIALSTVQTLLRQLEAKEIVGRDSATRVHRFSARIPREQVVRSATQDLVDKAFRGSVAGLVAHLIDQHKISSDEIAEIRRLIDAHEREGQR